MGNSSASDILAIHSFDDLPSMLLGSWKIERKITNLPLLNGKATFTPQSEGLYYKEEIKLVNPNGDLLDAFREYLYVFDNTTINIYFFAAGKKGNHFLTLTPKTISDRLGLHAVASHLCKDDTYTSEFAFLDRNTFLVSFTVKGPAKDYLIQSQYTRAI